MKISDTEEFGLYLERQLQDLEVWAAYEAAVEKELRWQKALAAARVRYASEIRKYRGIDRLRAMYRRRNR